MNNNYSVLNHSVESLKAQVLGLEQDAYGRRWVVENIGIVLTDRSFCVSMSSKGR
jgi:uncharacterized protein YaiI (UPF0178 family)